ncbi:hypothetical protein PGT21_017329 [Puccinia graminis f. sp. tritici]|uniref:RRM domain-containing protein n=1 Tax=Puccinia graminis f. sp. tritici TaxID=56615 RepID=A0A5B0P0R2_PUCGR|nr:hypothetical protein PGTUg99_004170 [Puccinia graminis f. sp. tritici]KAA1094304.1 hypothetical protein PGT21_017329 [Puccinia graminis f. sp. tritici]
MQSIRYPQPYLVLPSQLHPSHHPHHPSPVQDSRTQLFINNLPFRVRWQDLKDLFRKAGTVLRADVSLTPDNRSKGFGTVLFANRNDAFKAIEIYNGFSWQTRILDVKLDQQDPTGAFGMAAAASTSQVPSSQQKNYHQHQQYQQQQQQQHHHHHPMATVSHHNSNNNNHLTQPQNSLQLPPPAGNPINLHAQNWNGPSGGNSNTTSAGDPHQSSSLAHHPHHSLSPAQLPSIIPVSASNHFPAGQHSNSDQSLNQSINKPVHSYQKHQHSQSLIPFSDPSPNMSKSVFNPLLRTSTHRPSRSVQLSNPHPSSLPGSSSTASSSQTHPSRPLDVHQPAFKPSGNSLNQALSSLHISTVQAIPALPSVTISTAPPDSSSSVSSAPVDTSSPVSSPSGSVSQPQSGGAHSKSSSHIGSNPPHGGPHIHHPQLPPFHHYGPPHSYPPHHISSTTFNHAPYSSIHGQNACSASRLLFVGNLPFNLQWQDLKDLFRQAGNILRADVATTAEGRSRGFGTVLFATAEDAMKALEMYDGYELKGRPLKVRFDQLNHMSSSGNAAPGSWPDFPTITPPNFHPIHQGPHQSSHPLIQEPIPTTNETEEHPMYSSTTSGEETREEARSDLWAPEPVRPSLRTVPTIVPPALSPIASRRSSFFKSNNGTSEYSSSDGGQGASVRSSSGPEPIGHPASQPRPQTIPMPPPYAPGLVSPALPKTIQMTPSMPAFSFQPFMPATPPLLPNFFSPGIGPPPTPPYGRDGHTPPPAQAKPVHSPLGYNPMFPNESDAEEAPTSELDGQTRRLEDEEEGDDEQGMEPKRMNSNVDWGYQQSASVAGNRRTSLFVGRANKAVQGPASQNRLAPRGGFAGRRLLGVGEEADEEGMGAECASRRASFDVASLFNSQHPSPPAKLAKQRPSDIIISAPDNDSSTKPVDPSSLVSLPALPPPPPSDQNTIDRVDLVGLGFVDSIWTDKQ